MTLDPEKLEALLADEPYVEDGGFTAQVMAELPPPRRDPRPFIMAGSVAAALATAFAVLPGAVQLGLAAVATHSLPLAIAPGLVVGLAAAGCVAAVVGLVVSAEA
ncbi:MAG: hypothetical protein IPQ24_13115 [Anaeromyxobacter sp.]|nr:hypothetical protein [Anaeromyxobacter sp.]